LFILNLCDEKNRREGKTTRESTSMFRGVSV
jgi:hypothetical protein